MMRTVAWTAAAPVMSRQRPGLRRMHRSSDAVALWSASVRALYVYGRFVPIFRLLSERVVPVLDPCRGRTVCEAPSAEHTRIAPVGRRSILMLEVRARLSP